MTQLLEQAFAAVSALPQERQDELAQLILEEISRQQQPTPKKPRMLRPISKGSGYTDSSINHDAVLAEFIYKNKFNNQPS